MARSAERLGRLLDGVRFPADGSDFLVYELARLVQDGEASLDHEALHFLIEQGIRLHANPSIQLRAGIAERLRRAACRMPPSLRRTAMDVLGGVEDIDFPLEEIGAVVHSYMRDLFDRLEEATTTPEGEALGRAVVEGWKAGSIDTSTLWDRVGALGEAALAPVTDWLCESIGEPDEFDAALKALAGTKSPAASRVLAYLVSEPMLEEPEEAKVRSMLEERWPQPRSYMLYRLRQHAHEDIPYFWFKLLVETRETRAVDLILEEVVVHAGAKDYVEDLLAILELVERSADPGLIGKLTRLVTSESAPGPALDLVKSWVGESDFAEPVERAVRRRQGGHQILVPRGQDLAAFAVRHAGSRPADLWEAWNTAYHESLGWQQRADFPRGPVGQELDRELRSAMTEWLGWNQAPDEAVLRDQIESFQEDRLMMAESGVVLLAAMLMERPRGDPWMEEVRARDVNACHIRAAQSFDEGQPERARRYLDVVLEVEPRYPLAVALDRIMKESRPTV